MFLKKFISDVRNVYHRPKHMHSDDIAKVRSKSSRICCSATFSSRMVFSFKFKFVKFLQHCTLNINSQVIKIWWIRRPFSTLQWGLYIGLSRKNGEFSGWVHIWHNFIKFKNNRMKLCSLAYIWTLNMRVKYGFF